MDALTEVVAAATSWATDEDRAGALAVLACRLALEIETGSSSQEKVPAPTAALSKELRATLAELEELRAGDDAQSSLAQVLSTPIWDAARSEPTDAGPSRGKGRASPRKAADAVAATGSRRGDGAAS